MRTEPSTVNPAPSRLPLVPLASLMALATAASTLAHFPFLVPDRQGATAVLVMSETLAPDGEVSLGLLASGTYELVERGGRRFPLAAPPKETTVDTHAVALPGSGPRVIVGEVDLGIMQRGNGPAHRLVYFPKTIVGDPFAPDAATTGPRTVELVPVRLDAQPGAATGAPASRMALELRVEGAPLPNAPIMLITERGEEREIMTDASGRTEALPPGRYGAWARHWIDAKGEVDGRAYTQIRRYATLVVDLPGALQPAASDAAGASDASSPTTAGTPPVSSAGTLPRAVASFGATIAEGWLYVYGGHTGARHDYSTSTVSGRFSRIRLDALDGRWEELPGGPSVQGMNLVSHRGRIIRVGGMEPRNAPGAPADNHSLVDVAVFDPTRGSWTALTPLPESRSSHDLVVIGDTLVVVGGWSLAGAGSEPVWLDHALALDLTRDGASWERIEQPFRRRALIAAPLGSDVIVMGGFDEFDRPHVEAMALDTTTRTWRPLPPLPGSPANGFAPAACVLDGRLYASVTDGALLRLAEDHASWERVTMTTPRHVHRLVAHAGEVLLLGGARGPEMTDLIEAVGISAEPRRPSVLAAVAKRWVHPESEQVSASMGMVDEAFDALRFAESGGWSGDRNQLREEADRLITHLREVRVDGTGAPERFRALLAENLERGEMLRSMLASGSQDAEALSRQLALIRASCRDCHRDYRD